MIEFLNRIDSQLLLYLNGCNSPLADKIMWALTNGMTWIPLYLLFLFTLIRIFRKKIWVVLASIIVLVAVTDQTSVHLFKNPVHRLRPTHNPELENKVHIVHDYRGGLYGFVSSHAANTFGIALLMALFVRRKWFTWAAFGWAAVMSYTRIYLGVHFPGDVICGALWGMLMGLIVYLAARILLAGQLREIS